VRAEALPWRLVALPVYLASLALWPWILGLCSLSGTPLAVLGAHVAGQSWIAGPPDRGSCAADRRYRSSAIPSFPRASR
jgi:hypothetical protein